MVKNTTYDERTCISRNRYYNPKVHVSGWYDIQNDAEYVEKYNKMKEIHLQEYPNIKATEKAKGKRYQHNIKNQSNKDAIFYQNHGTDLWVTEHKAAFTKNSALKL